MSRPFKLDEKNTYPIPLTSELAHKGATYYFLKYNSKESSNCYVVTCHPLEVSSYAFLNIIKNPSPFLFLSK